MTIYERRKQHLDSRLAIYLADPKQRALTPDPTCDDGFQCCYRTADGRKCFIGQDIDDDHYNPDMEGFGLKMKFLPLEIQDLGFYFLSDCQQLHDKQKYWTETGLSDEGHYAYNYIIGKYCTP